MTKQHREAREVGLGAGGKAGKGAEFAVIPKATEVTETKCGRRD